MPMLLSVAIWNKSLNWNVKISLQRWELWHVFLEDNEQLQSFRLGIFCCNWMSILSMYNAFRDSWVVIRRLDQIFLCFLICHSIKLLLYFLGLCILVKILILWLQCCSLVKLSAIFLFYFLGSPRGVGGWGEGRG